MNANSLFQPENVSTELCIAHLHATCRNPELARAVIDRLPNSTVRTKRVKEARDDAKKEITEYRAKKEEEFKKFEAEVCRPRSPSILEHPFTNCP